MSESYYGAEHANWAKAGLKDYNDFSECVSYCNQTENGDDTLTGEWFYCDDDTLTIYWGTFGNYNSPGASHYTYAEVYDSGCEDDTKADRLDYEHAKAKWEACPEHLEEETIDE